MLLDGAGRIESVSAAITRLLGHDQELVEGTAAGRVRRRPRPGQPGRGPVALRRRALVQPGADRRRGRAHAARRQRVGALRVEHREPARRPHREGPRGVGPRHHPAARHPGRARRAHDLRPPHRPRQPGDAARPRRALSRQPHDGGGVHRPQRVQAHQRRARPGRRRRDPAPRGGAPRGVGAQGRRRGPLRRGRVRGGGRDPRPRGAPGLAARLAEGIQRPIELPEGTFRLTASVGLAHPGPGDTAATLLGRADTAMYIAKQHAEGGGPYPAVAEAPRAPAPVTRPTAARPGAAGRRGRRRRSRSRERSRAPRAPWPARPAARPRAGPRPGSRGSSARPPPAPAGSG